MVRRSNYHGVNSNSLFGLECENVKIGVSLVPSFLLYLGPQMILSFSGVFQVSLGSVLVGESEETFDLVCVCNGE